MSEVLHTVGPLARKSQFRCPQDTKVFVSAYRVGLKGEVIRAEETKVGIDRIEGQTLSSEKGSLSGQ